MSCTKLVSRCGDIPRARIPELLILALTNAAESRKLKKKVSLMDDTVHVNETYALAPTSRATPDVVDLVS